MALVVPPARERRESSRGSIRRGSRLLGDAWLAALPATGATEWTSADCCLLVHHLVLELEGDEDLARDAAVAWRQHQIDGACLAGLTPALLLEIYRSDARLGRLGLRLRLRKRLEAFLAAHGGAPWACAVESVEPLEHLHHHLHARRRTITAVSANILTRICGGDRRVSSLLPSHLTAGFFGDGADEAKQTAVVVPVKLTLALHKLVEGDSEDDVKLVATLSQRPLLYDLSAIHRQQSNDRSPDPYFQMRVNDGENSFGDCFELHRSSTKTAGDAAGAAFPAACSTFAAKLPLKLYPVFSAHPIHVVAAQAMVELSSFAGHHVSDAKRSWDFRPNLLAHAEDLRNLVAVDDWRDARRVDEMRKWEIVNTSPTVEYVVEGDGVLGKKPFYTPKVRVTFFLYQDVTQPFLETIMPIIFGIFANAVNMLYATDTDEYLGNEIAIGLTVVFMIPQLSRTESFNNDFGVNHLYVLLIFVGLIVSTAVKGFLINQRFLSKEHKAWVKGAALVFMVLSLVIPARNLCLYVSLKRLIQRVPRKVPSPMTFHGENQAHESVVDAEALVPFFEPPAAGDPKSEPRLNPEIIHDDLLAEAERAYPDPHARPWHYDAKRRTVRAGIARHQATHVADNYYVLTHGWGTGRARRMLERLASASAGGGANAAKSLRTWPWAK